MADVEQLAVACTWWYWSCVGRPLYPCSPAEAEDAQDEWDRESDFYRDQAAAALKLVKDQRGALELLAADPVARRHAIHAIKRIAHGLVPTTAVHAFGEGWRDLPQVCLFPGVAARNVKKDVRSGRRDRPTVQVAA